MADAATWRDLLWMLIGGPFGFVLGLGPAVFTFIGLWVVGSDIGTIAFGWWNTAPPMAAYQLVFLSMLPFGLAGLIAGPSTLKAHTRVASALLAPTRAELAAQLGRLTDSRSQVVDASAAELRRIERDLHDGAQARLVSVGMSIGLAEQLVTNQPDLALSLLAEARASNGQALAELRALVRGIHPPVLAERGLDGAVRALAMSLPLPVDVQVALMAEGRTNAGIAARLVITEKAVSKHINNVFTKLDLYPADEGNRRVLAVLTYLNA
jgi:signal transduction histidine kinase